MIGAVQAIEFAQHRGDRLAALRWFVADDDDLDAGAENVSLLLLQRSAPAGGDDEDEQQRAEGGTQHARQDFFRRRAVQFDRGSQAGEAADDAIGVETVRRGIRFWQA